MEITEDVITLAEKFEKDEDLRQDFYVAWLEMDEQEFDTFNQLSSFISAILHHRRMNSRSVEDNRSRLVEENIDKIRETLHGPDQYDASPEQMLEAEQAFEEMTRGMSDTLRRTFNHIFVDGLTPEDAARLEGVARNAIDQRVHVIKKHIKGELNV